MPEITLHGGPHDGETTIAQIGTYSVLIPDGQGYGHVYERRVEGSVFEYGGKRRMRVVPLPAPADPQEPTR